MFNQITMYLESFLHSDLVTACIDLSFVVHSCHVNLTTSSLLRNENIGHVFLIALPLFKRKNPCLHWFLYFSVQPLHFNRSVNRT